MNNDYELIQALSEPTAAPALKGVYLSFSDIKELIVSRTTELKARKTATYVEDCKRQGALTELESLLETLESEAREYAPNLLGRGLGISYPDDYMDPAWKSC